VTFVRVRDRAFSSIAIAYWLTAWVAPTGLARAESETAQNSESAGEAEESEAAPSSAWSERPFALEGHVGAGTPVGLGGVEFEYSILPLVAVGAGAGVGYGAKEGTNSPRIAFLARARPLRTMNHALAFGAAYSGGAYRAPLVSEEYTPVYKSDWVNWVQADAGWEWRSDVGFLLRLSAGFAVMLNPGNVSCFAVFSERCESNDLVVIPTIDLGLGMAF
jgi:hypothetical protein